MFWMMNGMGPHGRSMHHRGFFPMGGLFLVPGILFGGLIGLYAILAVLNVAGVVISAVLSGLAYVFTGLIEAFGSVFSGVFSGTAAIGSVIIGVVLGLIGYRMLRDRKARKAAEAEKA